VAFPRKLLTSDEEIVLDLRPHPIALAGAILVTILIIVAWILLLTHLPGTGTTRDVFRYLIIGAGLVLFVIYPLRRLIQWLTSNFVVTNERVIHRQGFIAKTSMEIPLDRIQNVKFRQGVFERIIGAGSLIIESAGERGTNVFSDIRHPESVQKVIYEHAEARTREMQGGAPMAAPTPSMTEELQRLADLRDRGAITEQEYQTHKARLLGGA